MSGPRLTIRPLAASDIDAIRFYYEQQRRGLGGEFLDELVVRLEEIEREPLSFPQLRDEFRRALLRRFPYHVYFAARQDEIEVIAVLHAARHPRTWRDRL